MPQLTNAAVQNAKPGVKIYRLYDERGLYLEVTPAGSKRWRLKYQHQRKEARMSLGVYPEVSLREAREARDEARRLLREGINPADHRRAQQSAQSGSESFEAVTREWHTKHAPNWSPDHAHRKLRMLEKEVFPILGHRPISDLEPPDFLSVLRRLEERGVLDTAHRVQQICSQAMRYAVATGRARRDPLADLRGALPPVRPQHHASVTDPRAVAELLRSIDYCEGQPAVRYALKLAPLVFVRPGELRRAEWAEINFDSAEWRIPAEKTKMRALHIVPLAEQSLEILRELQRTTGRAPYVFPSLRTRERPLSENTINAALRRLGYSKDDMTGHGFRSMASTMLHEQGWNSEIIERQLAHAERNSVKAAYNYAEHLPERRRMMQAWADYLDALRAGAPG